MLLRAGLVDGFWFARGISTQSGTMFKLILYQGQTKSRKKMLLANVENLQFCGNPL